MAAAPARARADYDYLIKLLLIGDSGWYLFPYVFFFYILLPILEAILTSKLGFGHV